ncbi:MAG: adenine phosphoribosyltransferase [Bacteroidales bacterium]|nr:adenine phosphoribosyltransferase [Bacteroidales bacterium]MDY6348236.1 adenine phosphoribosyltransferase [Bacteroidales bacterium]
MNIKDKIRIVLDFPTPGVQFYDITTLLNDAEAFQETTRRMLALAEKHNPEVIVALESRGFFFGTVLANLLKLPFVPVRKKGKLPFKTYQEAYFLEYGSATMEIHVDAMPENKRVLIVDDVLATGGSMTSAVNLVSHFHPQSISLLFLMELEGLKGRKKLAKYSIDSLITV